MASNSKPSHANDLHHDSTHLPAYTPPKSGLLAHVPSSWVPYGELMRIDRPVGIMFFYLPHLFGTLYAACILSDAPPTLAAILSMNAFLMLGNVFHRSAGCAWNDLVDREYDRQVPRCRLRPVARGAVSPRQAFVFTVALALLSLSFLAVFPPTCWAIASLDVALVAIYPFTKRFTDFPQLVLGINLSLGYLMGLAVMGFDFTTLLPLLGPTDTTTRPALAIAAFYLANVCWSVIYDTVYAQLDVHDDAKAGVHSMAVRFRDHIKKLLSTVGVMQVLLLVAAGVWHGLGAAYVAITCGGTAATLAYMIVTVDLTNPAECLWWFRNGCWLVGGPIAGGMAVEYAGWYGVQLSPRFKLTT